ncbi:MAG: hypothetical protein U1F43_03010 [Myxococcota bacterium]
MAMASDSPPGLRAVMKWFTAAWNKVPAPARSPRARARLAARALATWPRPSSSWMDAHASRAALERALGLVEGAAAALDLADGQRHRPDQARVVDALAEVHGLVREGQPVGHAPAGDGHARQVRQRLSQGRLEAGRARQLGGALQ